jgi:hypothetical protein
VAVFSFRFWAGWLIISAEVSVVPAKNLLKRLLVLAAFSIAFAYIEAAVVIYLRTIFYPDGFSFPLAAFGTGTAQKRLLATEVGRECATLVLILTGSWFFGVNPHQRCAALLGIFATWDVFYYIWLKVLISWPVSIMDWDILFLLPAAWASPMVAPVIVSGTMLAFAAVILYRDQVGRPLRPSDVHWLGFLAASAMVAASFCLAGRHIGESNFAAYFSWPIFALGEGIALVTMLACIAGGCEHNAIDRHSLIS